MSTTTIPPKEQRQIRSPVYNEAARFFRQQIKEESDRMDSLSMAFAKIQNSTGLSDVNEIVQVLNTMKPRIAMQVS